MGRSTRVGAGLAASLLAVGLAACGGGGDNGGGADATDESGVATVTFWDTSDSKNEAPKFEELIAKFEEANPKIKIDYVNVPFADAQSKFKTAAESGSGAPDVLRAEVAWTPEFASLGYLKALDDTSLGAETDAYLPTPLSSNEYDGKLYGVPQVTDAPALLYNKKMLADAGVEPPKTWADIEAAHAKLAASAPGTHAIFLNSGGYFLLPFIYSGGGDLLDPEGKKILVNSTEAVAGAQQALDLFTSGAAAPNTDATNSYNNMMEAFKGGQVAMIINGPWALADIKTGTAFADPTNIGVAQTPEGPDGKRGTPVGGHNYVIYTGTEVASASEKFIEFMNSAESQAFLAKELGLLPTRGDAYEQADTQSNPLVVEFQKIMEGATPRPWIPEGGGLFAALDAEFPKAIEGKQTAQEMLDAVAKTWKDEVVQEYTD